MTAAQLSRSTKYIAFALLLSLAACGGDHNESSGGQPPAASGEPMSIKGSDTMVILGQKWAETYMKKNSGTRIQISGGGSGTGIVALINGTTDICQASRPMKKSEREKVKAKYGHDVLEIPVAKDGIAVYVHADNPIREITMQQLEKIYTGEISNWRDLGGANQRIIVFGRENSSGTYGFFMEHVLRDKDFGAAVQTLPGTAAVVNAVSEETKAIGYGGDAYSTGVRALAIKKDSAAQAIAPGEVSIMTGTYPIARDLYFYIGKEFKGAEKEFVEWVMSEEGQGIVKKVGYYPIPKKKLAPPDSTAADTAKTASK
ncbi:MAG: phosphate ABC transporter substrate-binding protein PstS family protein [Rhizobacter sp.]|nr:phosphate ABC transporter substrate-binding protein PstS family protein [Chlorobiales bacterium]